MLKPNDVEDCFSNEVPHSELMNHLRGILLSFPFTETLKWNFPVYMINGKNVIGLGAFKAYAGIWFFQGSFLKDVKAKLVNAQEGKTQGMRQWRFTSLAEIKKDEKVIRSYIQEAIDNHKAGKKITPKPKLNKPLIIPPELQKAFDSDLSLKDSFEAHSLTNKRDFAEYIATAKRETTKQSRLVKITPMIQSGEGLNDKYKK